MLIIAEHGNYPRNDKGQMLYPRYEFFQQCVKVFEQDGRAVPVYNDKHLSYSFEKAKAMVDASRRLRFPMLAGSSIPVTWRLPAIDLPLGCEDRRCADGGRRRLAMRWIFTRWRGCSAWWSGARGGETGVKAVQMLEGDAVWKAGDGGPLFEGAADGGALAQRHAARADGARMAARRIWWHRASCRSS